jgi:hypothetical protein
MTHESQKHDHANTEETANGDKSVTEGWKDRFKQLMGTFELPKEAIQYIMKQVDETKKASVDVISREIRKYLQNVNLADEVTQILTRMDLEITTSIRFVETSKKKGKLRLRISRDDPAHAAGDETPSDENAQARPKQ